MCGETRPPPAGPGSRYSPGAVPWGLGSTRAPRGTIACRNTRAGISLPRAAKRARIASSTSGLGSNGNPSNPAASSRVTSSVVGPRPPVTKSRSQRPTASPRTSRMAGPSGTAVCRATRRPHVARRSEIAAGWELTTSPSSNSVPVLRISTVTRKRGCGERRANPRTNLQAPSQSRDSQWATWS